MCLESDPRFPVICLNKLEIYKKHETSIESRALCEIQFYTAGSEPMYCPRVCCNAEADTSSRVPVIASTWRIRLGMPGGRRKTRPIAHGVW